MLSVFSAVRDLVRLREISAVLVRHGFGEIVSRAGLGRLARKRDRPSTGDSVPPASGSGVPEIPADEVERGEAEKSRISFAERARFVLQDLGPSFIKLGQIASTRGDVLPPEVITELKKLQDDVPPVPFDDIRGVVEASLGAPLGELYVSFDEKPLATASIAQVHRAVLATPDGDVSVVVKVQRPGVAQTVARDVELLHIMAAAIERAIPETKLYSPVGLVQQFDRAITAELNYMFEADNADRFARNWEGVKNVRFPKVYKHASSKQVLTLEFFDGVKLRDALGAGFDGKVLANEALRIIVKMAFEDGFFHADPHPGNIFILGTPEAPVLGLIDVGMVGRLSPELRDRAIDLMVAAVRKDSYAIADALYAMGRPTRKIDMREYRSEVSVLAEKYLGRPLKEIDLSAMIRDLVQGSARFGIEIPADFTMAGKSLMTIEGIGKELDPDLDVLSEATPLFLNLLRKRYSPQRLGNELWRGVEQLSRVGWDVPLQLREVLDDLRLARLTVRVVDPQLPDVTYRLGRLVFTGVVVAAMVLAGAYLVNGDRHAPLGFGLLGFAVVVWSAHVIIDLRHRRRQRRQS